MPNNTVYLSFFNATSRFCTHFLSSTKALITLYYGDLFACPSFSPALTFVLKFLLGTNLNAIPQPSLKAQSWFPNYMLPFCPVLFLYIKAHLLASIQFLLSRTLSSLTIGTLTALFTVARPMPETVPGTCSSQLFENIRWTNECTVDFRELKLYLILCPSQWVTIFWINDQFSKLCVIHFYSTNIVKSQKTRFSRKVCNLIPPSL